MAKCGDCLYFGFCKKYIDPEETFPEIGGCHTFKSKDAFVEVVRCKGCLNYEETMGKDSGKPCGYGRCLHTDGLPGIVFDELFCAYGERREGE